MSTYPTASCREAYQLFRAVSSDGVLDQGQLAAPTFDKRVSREGISRGRLRLQVIKFEPDNVFPLALLERALPLRFRLNIAIIRSGAGGAALGNAACGLIFSSSTRSRAPASFSAASAAMRSFSSRSPVKQPADAESPKSYTRPGPWRNARRACRMILHPGADPLSLTATLSGAVDRRRCLSASRCPAHNQMPSFPHRLSLSRLRLLSGAR